MVNRALLVGIDEYEVPGNRLNSCVKDTYAFRDLLEQSDFSDDDCEIRMLHDEDATLENVRDGLDWLLADVGAEDRSVFFQSSHGHRYESEDRPGTFIEVLVCYDRDQYLEDTELVERSRQVAPGALTVVIDACHSGGMNKDYYSERLFKTTRAKVFQPPPRAVAAQAKSIAGAEAPSLKLFGRSAARTQSKLLAGSVPGAKGVKAQPEVEVNAVLLTACTARQTAAAGSEDTAGLSAFTYALIQRADASTPVSELVERAAETLDDLEMEQTPCCFAPPDLQPLLSEAFLAKQPQGKEHGTMTTTTTRLERDIEKVLKPIIDAATGAASNGGKTQKGYQTGDGAGSAVQRDVLTYATMLAPTFAAVSKAAGVKPKAPRVSASKGLMDKVWFGDVFDTSWDITNCFPPPYWDVFAEAPSKGVTADVVTRIERKVPRKVFENPLFWDAVVNTLVQLAPVVIDMVTGDGADSKALVTKGWFDDLVDGVGDFVEDALPVALEVAPYVLPLFL